MNTISMESHQEQITELQSQIEELESEKHCLEEELKDLEVEYEEKIEYLHKFNRKLVRSNKMANRDFFILAAAYVATLALMIYLFIR